MTFCYSYFHLKFFRISALIKFSLFKQWLLKTQKINHVLKTGDTVFNIKHIADILCDYFSSKSYWLKFSRDKWLVMCFEFSICWRAFNAFWGTLDTFFSLPPSFERGIIGRIVSYINLPWHSQKFMLCGSIAVPALMWKMLSWSLVSIQFQAPLLLISSVSSSPVQWVTLTKGWGSSRHVSWLSAFSVGCPGETRHRVAGGNVGQDWKQAVEKGQAAAQRDCCVLQLQLKHTGKSLACDWLAKWRSVPVKAEILAGAYVLFSGDPSRNFGPNARYKPDFLLSALATILTYRQLFQS